MVCVRNAEEEAEQCISERLVPQSPVIPWGKGRQFDMCVSVCEGNTGHCFGFGVTLVLSGTWEPSQKGAFLVCLHAQT